MTLNDSTDGESGSTTPRVRNDGRYVAYETNDGAFVIRDESIADAWIRSDVIVALPYDGT